MKRPHPSRGLAACAVSALAISGLAVVLPAGAAAAADGDVVLLSPFNDTRAASSRFENRDTAVSLVAQRLDPAATIGFEFHPDPEAGNEAPGWTSIPDVTSVGDFARAAWTPPTALVGSAVSVRASATDGGSTTYDTLGGVSLTADPVADPADPEAPFSAPHAVSLASDSVGFFDQPYASAGRTGVQAVVAGHSSASDGTVELSWWDPTRLDRRGHVDAAVRTFAVKTPSLWVGGSFEAAVDLTGFGAEDGDVIAFAAERETDDVRVSTLYEQHVAAVAATSSETLPGKPVEVRLSVTDAELGAPVAGAEVRRGSDGAVVGYTDTDGVILGSQAGATTETYYVNTTDEDAHQPGLDPVTSWTVPTYTQVAQSAQARTADGAVFDVDEYTQGDLYVAVRDQRGEPMAAGTKVSYKLYPSNGTPPSAYTVTETDDDGQAPIHFPRGGPDGEYRLDYHLTGISTSDAWIDFVAGEAALELSPGAVRAAAGGQAEVTGRLTVAGRPLDGRRVDLAFRPGVEAVPGRGADAGILVGGGLRREHTVTTNDEGGFTVTVADTAEAPQAAEVGGLLRVSTGETFYEDAPLRGNARASAAAAVDFGSGKGGAALTLTGRSKGKRDRLVVKGPDSVAGETVQILRVQGKRTTVLATRVLDGTGGTSLAVRDRDRRKRTTYAVRLVESARVLAATSKRLRLR